MERIFLNQTALSLGYIALKRIREIESSKTRLPPNPLLRHIAHVRVLAACVEQVGPEEIIEYEINQDCGVGGPSALAEEETVGKEMGQKAGEREWTGEDVAERNRRVSARLSIATRPLQIINEDVEDDILTEDDAEKTAYFSSRTRINIEEDGEYSMEDLYDEYNAHDDDNDWETASDLSEDGPTHIEDVPIENYEYHPSPSRTFADDTDSDSEDDIPSTPPSSNFTVSRSPPLDIAMRHPITYELSKREKYRQEVEASSGDLSRAFVEQFEEVLCHDIRLHSMHRTPGSMRLGTPQISLCA